MHATAVGLPRKQRVRQVLESNPAVFDFEAYVPVGAANQKLQSWKAQGAEIQYLSSHQQPEAVEKDRQVLRGYGFPDGQVLFREGTQSYADLVEASLPDVLIEDDCESIGGSPKMVYPNLPLDLQERIRSWVVIEFGGIDHLPDILEELVSSSRPLQ